jgi:hypothetical protein
MDSWVDTNVLQKHTASIFSHAIRTILISHFLIQFQRSLVLYKFDAIGRGSRLFPDLVPRSSFLYTSGPQGYK